MRRRKASKTTTFLCCNCIICVDTTHGQALFRSVLFIKRPATYQCRRNFSSLCLVPIWLKSNSLFLVNGVWIFGCSSRSVLLILIVLLLRKDKFGQQYLKKNGINKSRSYIFIFAIENCFLLL